MGFMNANRIAAREYFGISGDPNLVLHHIDMTLKDRDPVRYAEWRIEDLEVMTKEEHVRLHRPFLGHSHSEYSKSKIAAKLKGREMSDIQKQKLSEVKKEFYIKHPDFLDEKSAKAKEYYANHVVDYHLICKSCGAEFIENNPAYKYCEKCRSNR